MIDLNRTIVAISTANGMGAIALVRLSGKESKKVCSNFVSFTNSNMSFDALKPKNAVFCNVMDGDTVLDEVVMTYYKSPNSYTGEDIIEIACHGSVYIQQRIVELCIKNGASMAMAGEFTQRAFLNGKIDLSQAEAVSDLISSESKAAQQIAMDQMKGGFSQELSVLRAQLLNFISLVELELDFSEEDVEFADRSQLLELVTNIDNNITKLSKSFKLGNAIKNGIPVAIVGSTNAGKSTLLNQLLNEDKAIVSDIHGTTRDVIEDTINIDGLLFRFIDTAGIRKSDNEIERIGIERTYERLKLAQIVLLVVDVNLSSELMEQSIREVSTQLNDSQKLIVLVNKLDSVDVKEEDYCARLSEQLNCEVLGISAKEGIGVDALNQTLVDFVNSQKTSTSGVIVSNARHYEALTNAHQSVQRVIEGLNANISGDFLAQDIREVINILAEITGGEILTDEVLGNIFKNFCIGK